MDTEPDADRRERVVDWLASHPDLPHLFARLSELVHVLGYAPEELVVIPRSEIDRRETTAFTSGWAEAVSDELPRIRREYERRVADAYAQGQGDGRGIRRQQRRTDAGTPGGARVIALPFARLLEPPAAVVEAEERVRRERELFEQGSRSGPEPEPDPGTGPEPDPGTDPEPEPGPGPDPDPGPEPDPAPAPGPEGGTGPGYGDGDGHGPGAGAGNRAGAGKGNRAGNGAGLGGEGGRGGEPEPEHGKEPAPGTTAPEAPVTAQEGRARRTGQPVRKVVRGKGGRPIVPPLSHVPGQQGAGPGERREPEPRRPRRLSERAKALEEELAAERAQEAPPESAP
ncbi:hypothetical protein ACFYOG_02045 [Streptomyces sp. NPDC007818]|uniref:hypothetical protein n=1 Tax=Streptomyces sp. NPDC007818 TaxID=3364780 RepID=UPI00369A8F34